MSKRGVRRGRLGRSYMDRPVAVRELRERFLIVCEGEKTEPNYFESLRVQKRVQMEIIGTGFNTISLVNEAIRLKNINPGDYNHVWCVFDKDEFSVEDFNSALDAAKHNDIHVAYSNPAFELWYYLHFHYCDAALHRHDLSGKLTDCLGRKYEKNSPAIYDALLDKQSVAIRNAQNLLNSYHPPDPANNNPSTTAHLLVEALNEAAKRNKQSQ